MSKKNKEQIFAIPESFFDRLYEFTGSNEEMRGFVLAYISADNAPVIKSICRNPTIEMALHKTMGDFLNSQRVSMQDIHPSQGDDEEPIA